MKWHRAHKRWIARELPRARTRRHALRGLYGSMAAMQALFQVNMLAATPASQFSGGVVGKTAVIASRVIESVLDIKRAMDVAR